MNSLGLPRILTDGRSGDEAQAIYRRADHRYPEVPRGGSATGRSGPRPWLAEDAIYTWKAKYGGMDVPEAKRLKELEVENKKLKKLLAETMLEKAALKDALGLKWLSLPRGDALFATGPSAVF